ncbi:MAG TPA: lytic transglycosylase domain-containing protein [Candidatus Limnocylindrales bacterium]|nr:lytic transglycosylase domain-containing protein [Candidatus Limnocylindrales bacterium]
MRLTLTRCAALAALILLSSCVPACADYVVLRSGARVNVTGYEILGDRYKLHIQGGVAEVPVEDIVAIEPEEIFEPSTEPLTDKTPFQKLIRDAAARYHLDPTLIHSVISIESNFNPKAVSHKNARGLMQLMPRTAELMGVKDSFDPGQNIDGGSHYLSGLLKKYKNDLTLALAAYNAGPDSVDKYGRRVPPYLETMKYVQRITKTYAKLKADAANPLNAPGGLSLPEN